MANSRGTIEHGQVTFTGQTEMPVVYTGRHIVPVVTVCGFESGNPNTNAQNAKVYFTVENVTVAGFTIKASAEFSGKVFYIISSEGI